MLNFNLEVNANLPTINTNFGIIKSQLKEKLSNYNLVVDKDSISVAKKMATEINKMSKQIDTIRKEKVSELSAPIKDFEDKAKVLTSLCQTTRKNLLDQVKIFEDKERIRAKNLLEKELQKMYSKYGVRDEFKTVKVDDLAIISNLIKSGIAKKAYVAIDDRVMLCKKFQEKIDNRLLTLDSICYEGGLIVPLERENINHFLMLENDNEYLEKLTSLIKNEITRLEKAEKVKEKQEAQKVKVLKEVEKPISNENSKEFTHFKNMQEFAPAQKDDGKRTYIVTATFEVEVDKSLAPKLGDMLKEKFAKNGFKQIPQVEVREKQINIAK